MSEKKTYLLKYKDLCRCCLDNPGTKSMWDEYLHDNERETYGEMISECFGIKWDADNEELICDSCICRLREAVKLKIEFLAVQELLKENVLLENDEPKPEVEFDVVDESEMVLSELNDTESIDDSGFRSAHQIEISQIEKRGKRPYRKYTKEDMDNAIKAVTVHGKSMLEASTKYSVPRRTLLFRITTPVGEDREARYLNEEKRLKLIKEIRKLFKLTNIVPFKTKTTKRYCCFCFTDGPAFDDASELRSHLNFYHKTNYIRDIEFIMRPFSANEILKVDITDLQCTSCNQSIDDWNSMFVHLAEAHGQEFDEAYCKVIPFSIGAENKCVLCYEIFTTFGNLDVHMNAHFCNYMCHECGDPFLSASRFDAHLRLHKMGKFPCEMCDKVFALQQHKMKHMESQHGDKDKLISNSMADDSDTCSEIPCEYCGKCYNSNAALHIHIQKTHIKKKKKSKKNYVCGVCGKEFEKFVNLKYHWREHMEMIPFRQMPSIQLT